MCLWYKVITFILGMSTDGPLAHQSFPGSPCSPLCPPQSLPLGNAAPHSFIWKLRRCGLGVMCTPSIRVWRLGLQHGSVERRLVGGEQVAGPPAPKRWVLISRSHLFRSRLGGRAGTLPAWLPQDAAGFFAVSLSFCDSAGQPSSEWQHHTAWNFEPPES